MDSNMQMRLLRRFLDLHCGHLHGAEEEQVLDNLRRLLDLRRLFDMHNLHRGHLHGAEEEENEQVLRCLLDLQHGHLAARRRSR